MSGKLAAFFGGYEIGRLAAGQVVAADFRRRFLASLRILAAEAAPGGRLDGIRAIVATTIFHRGLRRLGFEPEPDGVLWSAFVAAYQRALLTSLHLAGRWRVRRLSDHRARRVWMSREMLLARYGNGDVRPMTDAPEGRTV